MIDALKKVSGGDWFIVVERKGLQNLVRERQLVRSTRLEYDGEQKANNVLKPLIFAGLIIEGGIVSYDTNIVSGRESKGIRYWNFQTISNRPSAVAMRVIAVQTGEVLMTVSLNKTIASYQTADVFRFFDLRTKVLEIESGACKRTHRLCYSFCHRVCSFENG